MTRTVTSLPQRYGRRLKFLPGVIVALVAGDRGGVPAFGSPATTSYPLFNGVSCYSVNVCEAATTGLINFSVTAAGWSSQVARRAHNPKVGGSNPPPATKKEQVRVLPWRRARL
jgi:hypothetical protein